jgi:hypothetical protein
MQDLILYSACEVLYQIRWNTAWESVIEITIHILAADAMRFMHDSLVAIGIF